MPPTPASIGVNVRAIGTNRASKTAALPYFSKKSCASCTCSCLKKREFGRLYIALPRYEPNQYPTGSPRTAAAKRSGIRTKMLNTPREASIPDMKRREETGRKNQKKTPDSRKMTVKSPG